MAALVFLKQTKTVAHIRETDCIKLNAHRITFYNVGNTVAFVNKIPVLPNGGNIEESDGTVLCHYTDDRDITFDASLLDEGETPNNHLIIIQKLYFDELG